MRWLIALALALPGCSQSSDSCGDQACTAEFRMVTVRIVNTSNVPVTGLVTRSTYLETNQQLQVSQDSGTAGTYVVVDDNFLGQREARLMYHTIRFAAMSAAGTVTADYVIAADECACHIDKLSGPEQLVMQ